MVEKKVASVKKTKKKQGAKGDKYVCDVCGLSIIVDEVCGCVEEHAILCCDRPMKPRKSRAKAAKK